MSLTRIRYAFEGPISFGKVHERCMIGAGYLTEQIALKVDHDMIVQSLPSLVYAGLLCLLCSKEPISRLVRTPFENNK
jgi:hypothetical protein